MPLHTDAIAQNCAPGIGAGGIDGNDADLLLLGAVMRGQPIHQGAFAGARRASDASEIGLASPRKQNAQQLFRFLLMIFDGGNSTREGADVSGADAPGPLLNGL